MGCRSKFLPAVLLACLSLTIAACGSTTSYESGGDNTNKVSGVASKGPLSGATVTVYALENDGTVGMVLGTATTSSDGTYSLYIGGYSGNMLVTATGGSYLDEATGLLIANPDTFRAGVVNASGPTTANITPYTEIAVRHAGSYAAANISSANIRVSNMLGGIDIINTTPSDVTDAASSSDPQDSIEYGLASAAISQAVAAGRFADVEDVVDSVSDDLADAVLDVTAAAMAVSAVECASGDVASIEEVLTTEDMVLDDALLFYGVVEIPDDAAMQEDMMEEEEISCDCDLLFDDELLTVDDPYIIEPDVPPYDEPNDVAPDF